MIVEKMAVNSATSLLDRFVAGCRAKCHKISLYSVTGSRSSILKTTAEYVKKQRTFNKRLMAGVHRSSRAKSSSAKTRSKMSNAHQNIGSKDSVNHDLKSLSSKPRRIPSCSRPKMPPKSFAEKKSLSRSKERILNHILRGNSVKYGWNVTELPPSK